MKIKTADLTGATLDWAVEFAHDPALVGCMGSPSTNWAQGGLIIDRETISVISDDYHGGRGGRSRWSAAMSVFEPNAGGSLCYGGDGPTPLIAAMRCFVASKLGDEVDVPEELCS